MFSLTESDGDELQLIEEVEKETKKQRAELDTFVMQQHF